MIEFLRVLMRTLPSSPRNRLFKSRHLSHGLKSGFCSFSSSQSHLRPRSYILSHQRSVRFLQTPFHFFSFILCLQFVRNVGITHGDESRVGYYVGMLVRFEVTVVLCLPCLLALSSNLYSSSLRPLRSYIGARSLISSAVSQSSSLDCSAYRYRCSDLDSRLPIGALLYGTYPFLKIGHLIHFS